MNRYVKTMSASEWHELTSEQHPILALPQRYADMQGKDEIMFYQKKVKKSGGVVVGAGTVERVIPCTLNECGRIGPPRALLRFWAEHIVHANDVVEGLDELGEYELPSYKAGAVLDWMWSVPLLRHVKKTEAWPTLCEKARMSGLPQLECVKREEDLRAKIVACEQWLSRCGLIDQYGGYKEAAAVAILDWPVVEYRQGRPLSHYHLFFAPTGIRRLD